MMLPFLPGRFQPCQKGLAQASTPRWQRTALTDLSWVVVKVVCWLELEASDRNLISHGARPFKYNSGMDGVERRKDDPNGVRFV
jgi:hypothetical protein